MINIDNLNMKKRVVKRVAVGLVALMSPVLVINYWHGDNENLSTALILALILLCVFIGCCVVGMIRKRRYLTLSLPAFVISIIGMFAILNLQLTRNEKNAELIILSV